MKRCGLEWPPDREEEEAEGYTDRLAGEPWCRGFFWNGLRFQGEVLWCELMPLLPSSHGREPCSSEGRHTWLPVSQHKETTRNITKGPRNQSNVFVVLLGDNMHTTP